MKIGLKINKTILFLILTSITCAGQVAKAQTKGKPSIPIDKKLDVKWVKSLYEKGERKVYSGEGLKYISMPCGGIGAGQVEVTGEGKISFTESVYNIQQKPNAGHGLSTGYQYIHPQKVVSKVENNFSLLVTEKGKTSRILKLSGDDFDAISFVGEYPLAQFEYGKTGEQLPIKISSEVFSPFVPLSLRSSANPVTVLKFKITNTSKNKVAVSLAGWMKNINFSDVSKVKQINTVNKSKSVKGISFEMQTTSSDSILAKKPTLGGFSLSVLDDKAVCSVQNKSIEEFLGGKLNKQKSIISNKAEGGVVSSSIQLKPSETREVVFLISWCFPNKYEKGKRYKAAKSEAPGWVGHIYNNWYSNSFDVAKYVAGDFKNLYAQTKLFRDTYFDTTLPYWLANRITMPVSTLAAGNVSIWENGRMYAYEGIGFCQGTCGHVYNFVTAIANLFPELERSVRLKQDFNSKGPYGGYSSSGRINFRGYGVNKPEYAHSYASDAQSGYVLKAYREHLRSPNNDFLDAIWEEVKGAIGFQIFKDGAEIGLEPNGVLEGEQTFWDPMWYGPNPYNNSLYLAALRAAEEMAIVKEEPELAARYHALFKTGQKFMDDKMWNGEFYYHLYPVGMNGNVGVKNGFKLPSETDLNAESYIKAFNEGRSGYFPGTACDAQQLFGQNWATQLGLGYILSPEKCKIAAKSIFKYNWTPDIGTIYDFQKPNARVLAKKGEAAMINGGWTKEEPHSFENTHDKTNVWTGLEYEAACDMINEGLLDEALVSIRSIEDRYDGSKRNPWNEVEGSDHYSRAMHSWNVLLSLSGYTFNGPAGKLSFAPKLNPENFKSFFSSAEGWGTISQIVENGKQEEKIALKWGSLRINQVSFVLTLNKTAVKAKVTINGKKVASKNTIKNGVVVVAFEDEHVLKAGQNLKVVF